MHLPTRKEVWARIGDASTLAWLWPPAATVVVAVIGLLQHVPLFYVVVGAALMFAAVANGLLYFDKWLSRKRVEHKLSVANIRLGKKLKVHGEVQSVALGLSLKSTADFPIEFEIVSLYTELDNHCPPKKPYAMSRITIPPNGEGWFDDNVIELPAAPKSNTVEGSLSFTLRYGRHDRLRYELKKAYVVYVGFDEHGNTTVANWQEGAQT